MDRGKQVVMAGLMVALLGMPAVTGLEVSAGQAEAADPSKEEADQILKLCREQLQKQQYEVAIQACQQAAESLRQRRNRNGEARGITNLGIAYLNRSQPEKAIGYFQQSLPMFKSEKDRSGEAIALINLGNAYMNLSQYEQATSYFQQALSIYRALKDRSGEAVVLTNLGNAYNTLSLSQYDRAISYYQQALPLYQSLTDRNGEVNVLTNLGNAYRSLSQHQQAIGYYEKALVIYRAVQDRGGESQTLDRLSSSYLVLKQYDRALQVKEQALTIAREQQNRDREREVLGSIAFFYEQMGQHDRALRAMEQALAIVREQKNRNGEREELRRISLFYDRIGQPDKAVATRQQMLTIPTDPTPASPPPTDPPKVIGSGVGQSGQVSQTFNVEPCSLDISIISETYVSPLEVKCQTIYPLLTDAEEQLKTSQFTSALRSLEQALKLYRELGIRSYLIEKQALYLLGEVSIALGDHTRAVNYHQQYLVLIREIRSREIKYEGEPTGYLSTLLDELNALYFLATAYTDFGDYSQALNYAQQGVQIAQGQNDNGPKWLSLKTLGYVYAYFGEYSQAITSYKQSLELARSSKDEFDKRERTKAILNELGLLYLWRGDYSTSLDYFQRSFASFTEAEQRGKFVDFREKAWILNNLGLVYERLGDYPKAINYQQESLAAYKKVEDNHHLLVSYKKVTYQVNEVFALRDLGSALLKAGKLMEAELVLREAIRGTESLRQGLTDSYNISFGDTQRRPYNILQQVLIAQNKVEPALEIAERGRARAFVELVAAKQATSNQPPNVKSLNIAQIKQIAREQNTTLVQYSLIDDEKQGKSVYIWVVSSTGDITFRTVALKTLKQQQNTNLAQLVDQSRETIGARGRASLKVKLSPEWLKQQKEQQTQKLKQLHQILIEPIADLLPKDPNQRVIFMPQGELFLVPFSALLNANNKPLIEEHTILTAPSIQVLELTRQQRDRLASRKSANNKSLIVGNPTMPKVVTQVGKTPVQLSDLPGAKQEAMEIATLLKTKAITGAQATESAIAQQMLNARIIHLATHGLLDDTKGLGVPGAIALAPSGNGQLNDGLLTSDEILDMKLNAELVVLSACDTGRGRITGDGVIGLSRSLITAGVPSIIVSLWKVPDEPTALLMTEFYKNLKKSPDKAQALRQAMLTTKQQYPDPLNWAAFTLIGEAE